ncbi:MAG: hypothetical protein K0S23_1518 [Fluviicola sp.]|jgi:antibiotic biosynthesis monooxygenase (ABM) superfamily enzyme|nr:hypothetical protein [Fluviicola sp.]
MKTKARLMMALKIWIVIYPSITFFLFLFSKSLSGLALYERTFLLTITLVPWTVFVGVPLVDILLNYVLNKRKKQSEDSDPE